MSTLPIPLGQISNVNVSHNVPSDIDNCLYPKSKSNHPHDPPSLSYSSKSNSLSGAKVHDLMADLIDQYFQKHLNLPQEEAIRLHTEYYQTYGLAIEGLVRHHEIDPLAYNSQVDDALPLEGIIKPRPELKKLLEDIDRSKVRLWLFTNAYVNHAKRVVRLLGIEDKFDGVTYCDYSSVPFVCKPHKDAYVKAMKEAGVESWDDCYFVGEFMSMRVNSASLKALLTRTQTTATITASRRMSLGGMRLIL